MNQHQKQKTFTLTPLNNQESMLEQINFIFETLNALHYTTRDIANFTGLRISEVNETKKAKTPMFMRPMCLAHSLGVEPKLCIERHNGETKEIVLSLRTPYPLAEGKVFLTKAFKHSFIKCLDAVLRDDEKTDLDIERLSGIPRLTYLNVIRSIADNKRTNYFNLFSCDTVLRILALKTKSLTIKYDLTTSRTIVRGKEQLHPTTYNVFK